MFRILLRRQWKLKYVQKKAVYKFNKFKVQCKIQKKKKSSNNIISISNIIRQTISELNGKQINRNWIIVLKSNNVSCDYICVSFTNTLL